MASKRTLTALATLALALGASAAAVQHCPTSDVCYHVAVPESTASSGSGNIYFSISAPTSYQWVALGTGSSMAGANMFIMYQDGQGNVTLSPRLGSGHVMPTLDQSSGAAQLTLLAGSGVNGTTMTANVRCANCQSWGRSGSLSVTSTSAAWIGAWKRGSSLATTNRAASLSQHDDTTQYSLDMTKATVASDSNPFVSSGSSGSSGTGTGTGSGSGSGSGSSGSSGSGSGAVQTSGPSKGTILTAHAVIMSIVVVALYPLGSALMPMLGRWLVHGIWQTVAYLMMWAGFALGVVVADQRGMLFTGSARTHTALGTFVVAAFGIQPFLGLAHHRHYVKHQGRGIVSHFHIWWGRALMVLGIVNGGLGLKLADASTSVIIGYSIASAVAFLAYVAAKAVGSLWLSKQRAQKLSGSNSISDGSPNSRRGSEPIPLSSRPQHQAQEISRPFQPTQDSFHRAQREQQRQQHE